MSLDTPFAVRTSPGEDAAHLLLAGQVDRDAEVELLAVREPAGADRTTQVG